MLSPLIHVGLRWITQGNAQPLTETTDLSPSAIIFKQYTDINGIDLWENFPLKVIKESEMSLFYIYQDNSLINKVQDKGSALAKSIIALTYRLARENRRLFYGVIEKLNDLLRKLKEFWESQWIIGIIIDIISKYNLPETWLWPPQLPQVWDFHHKTH